MRKLFVTAILFAMVCMLVPRAQSQVTVTGNLKNLGHANVTAQNAFVRFRLNGFGAFLPTVDDGSGVIVSEQQDFKPDVFGNINGPLVPNDLIKPHGTFYQACVYFQGIQFRCSTYLVNSAPSTFNMNTAPSLTTVPAASPNQLVLQTFPCVVSVAATTWTCAHNFNDSPVMVSVYDATGKQIFPDTVNVSNLNVATLTFVTPQAGTALISHAGAITLATNQTNAVLQNPTASQVIQGPSLAIGSPTTFTGSLTCTNFENIRCVDQFTGVATENKVNAAAADLGSTPGFVMIPGNLPANSVDWSIPPNNVGIWDQRFTGDQGLMKSQPFMHAHWYHEFHAGANDSYESNVNSGKMGISINAFAEAGGFAGAGGKANVISLFGGVSRLVGSDRPIWSANFSTSYASYGSIATGIETDCNNIGALDDLSGMGVCHRIISGGTKKVGTAIQINSIGAPTNFRNGILLNNYDVLGIQFSNQSASRTADIYIIPPANDSAPELIGRNAANAVTVWSIDDIGNITTNGIIRAALYASPTPNFAASGVLRCASSDGCVVWRNTANSADAVLAKDASDRLTFAGNTVQTPVYNAAGTIQNGAHTVSDSGTLSSGTPSTVTVTLTGSAAFTSSSSYNCTVTNKTTQANPLKVTYSSGSSFVVTGPNTVTDGFSFICVGN
jgi:hypothetical protein